MTHTITRRLEWCVPAGAHGPARRNEFTSKRVALGHLADDAAREAYRAVGELDKA